MRLKISWTIPNILTTIRLLAIPVMAVLIYWGGKSPENWQKYYIPAFCFFVGIWLTDAADGFIARHYNQISEFGKIYDPFVDKLFQFTTAFMMFLVRRLPLWVVIFLLVKEVLYLLCGLYLMQVSHIVVPARWYGKISTILFVASLACVFFVSHDMRYLINYIFIPPVLMSSFATVMYGITLFSPKPGNPDQQGKNSSDGTDV